MRNQYLFEPERYVVVHEHIDELTRIIALQSAEIEYLRDMLAKEQQSRLLLAGSLMVRDRQLGEVFARLDEQGGNR
jgi:hypothetical protein